MPSLVFFFFFFFLKKVCHHEQRTSLPSSNRSLTGLCEAKQIAMLYEVDMYILHKISSFASLLGIAKGLLHLSYSLSSDISHVIFNSCMLILDESERPGLPSRKTCSNTSRAKYLVRFRRDGPYIACQRWSSQTTFGPRPYFS